MVGNAAAASGPRRSFDPRWPDPKPPSVKLPAPQSQMTSATSWTGQPAWSLRIIEHSAATNPIPPADGGGYLLPARTLRYDRQSLWLATGFDRRSEPGQVNRCGVCRTAQLAKRRCSVDQPHTVPVLSDKPDLPGGCGIVLRLAAGGARGKPSSLLNGGSSASDVARLGVCGSCRVLDALG